MQPSASNNHLESEDQSFDHDAQENIAAHANDVDYGREFIYENPERLVETLYFSYLRSHDDMI